MFFFKVLLVYKTTDVSNEFYWASLFLNRPHSFYKNCTPRDPVVSFQFDIWDIFLLLAGLWEIHCMHTIPLNNVADCIFSQEYANLRCQHAFQKFKNKLALTEWTSGYFWTNSAFVTSSKCVCFLLGDPSKSVHRG